MGIDRNPPVWPSIQYDGGYQSASSWWIVERGVGAVIKWSCGVIERCVNMSVSQHPSTGYHDCSYLVVSLRFALQVSLSVLQHNLCILHVLGIQS